MTTESRLRNTGVALLLLLGLAACGAEPPAQQHYAPEVAVQTAQAAAVPLELTYTAHTLGSREVEVRARVSGILLKRRFEEGSRVRQGQPMFLIDPEPFRARVASARADVAVAQARLDEARRQRDRVLPLFEQNAVSQSRRDEAVSGFEVAQATLAAVQSNLRTAELDLEYTDVRAPIDGLTSREQVSEGSLVSTASDSSLLTRIVQIDPLYVEFSAPEAEAAFLRSGLLPAKGALVPTVRLQLQDGTEHSRVARVTFVDNAVDARSGTVRVRAVLDNPDASLIPGQFVRAHVDGVLLTATIAIPRKALMSSAQGSFVWVVGADEKVEIRPVRTGRGLGNDIIVISGLANGERFIVEGVLKVQPGIQVSAVSVDPAARQAEIDARKGDDA